MFEISAPCQKVGALMDKWREPRCLLRVERSLSGTTTIGQKPPVAPLSSTMDAAQQVLGRSHIK